MSIMRFGTVIFGLLVILAHSLYGQETTLLQTGDIIFQSSTSGQSLAIQLATHSKYSHVGLIVKRDGKILVYEAIQPVVFTPLEEWIDRGDEKHYVVKRLKPSIRTFAPDDFEQMIRVGQRYKGKKYDFYFEWSDDRVYCSELVWKIYKYAFGIEIGTLQKLKEFDLSNHIVRDKLQERYAGKIPYDELVISPARIFESDKLLIVIEK
jgi:uncharacterized protein YycO